MNSLEDLLETLTGFRMGTLLVEKRMNIKLRFMAAVSLEASGEATCWCPQMCNRETHVVSWKRGQTVWSVLRQYLKGEVESRAA